MTAAECIVCGRPTPDNPPCTNPAHLSIGTHADNMADAVAKGRLPGNPNLPRGEAVKNSKLTADKVREIRALAAQGQSKAGIGRRFGVSEDTVRYILAGKRWSHVA